MSNTPNNGGGFGSFAAKRIIVGVLLLVTVLWMLGIAFGLLEKPDALQKAQERQEQIRQDMQDEKQAMEKPLHAAKDSPPLSVAAHDAASARVAQAESGEAHAKTEMKNDSDLSHDDLTGENTAQIQDTPIAPAPASETVDIHSSEEEKDTAPPSHEDETHEKETIQPADTHGTRQAIAGVEVLPKGVKFVEATIHPLEYELTERWWGWRPNDILNFSDNVNNYQLGVLEVTRRTVVSLAERLSRTGTTAAFDRNLENAMNWFMVKADRYWFPSPEGKYKDGIAELRRYMEKLKKKEATFFTRPDNIIPLLMSYEDLLGSCDENLVKAKEEDGSDVSHFQSDDYFFYAQGVAGAMSVILEAIMDDFIITLESRHGVEILHHAIESCHRARDMDPWLVTNADLDGVLANHRANIAAPISHARFYIGVLIKTLST